MNIRAWTGVFQNPEFCTDMARAERSGEMQADKDEPSQPKSERQINGWYQQEPLLIILGKPLI